ncbi:hypothetical protein T05_16508 [Trichinella murrelli]|uniref:Uncharacterized protein n=1 Tax=Trichinella murrelli TaxID=144512 RepID=A0A0V0T5P3_9BILA|nr:hypothetical protein T05_16508 [Trichinella murrelli]
MYVPPQTGDVTAAWWCHLGKIGLRRSVCRGTASSGQSVPPVSSTFAPGGVPGMSVAPLPTLSCRALPSCGRASVFLVRPSTRSRACGNTSHLYGGRTSTSVIATAFTGGPSRARAHGRCALRVSGYIPQPLGFLHRRVPNLYVQR